jgi:dihydrofolate synthase/folylpolyglutamate synthase
VENAIVYLNSLGLHSIKPGLERIIKLLEIFDNPQDKVPAVLIAGTNGKGSVAATIASVLKAHGYNTGLYTSPHLIRVSERIKINGEEISSADLYKLILEIKEASLSLPDQPSYFEVLTTVAFLYFARRKIDFSVIEVGMGGRWDATNVVSPLVSVITNISKDHTEFLGQTIGEITFEKAGIIKYGVPLVTAAKERALEIIQIVAGEKSAPISLFKKDFKIKRHNTDDLSYFGRTMSLRHFKFSLSGLYQIENVSVAVAALEIISQLNWINLKEDNLRIGLSSVRWEGRMEILRKNPPLILDGAHNPGAAKALRTSIEKMFPGKKFVFLIGMLTNKDHESFLSEISQVAEHIVVTDVPVTRGVKSSKLLEIAEQFLVRVEIVEDFEKAFRYVMTISAPVCITGSLYLVGAIKGLLN